MGGTTRGRIFGKGWLGFGETRQEMGIVFLHIGAYLVYLDAQD